MKNSITERVKNMHKLVCWVSQHIITFMLFLKVQTYCLRLNSFKYFICSASQWKITSSQLLHSFFVFKTNFNIVVKNDHYLHFLNEVFSLFPETNCVLVSHIFAVNGKRQRNWWSWLIKHHAPYCSKLLWISKNCFRLVPKLVDCHWEGLILGTFSKHTCTWQ